MIAEKGIYILGFSKEDWKSIFYSPICIATIFLLLCHSLVRSVILIIAFDVAN